MEQGPRQARSGQTTGLPGYVRVHRKPLHRVFSTIHTRYDIINRLMTLGLDQHWRRLAAVACLNGKPRRVLDLCCGTGDLAIIIARLDHGVEVAGLDYSPPMLEMAGRKAVAAGTRVDFVHGDVADLPFSGRQFDCAGIAFAFRNLTYKNTLAPRYFSEILRVLKVGGRFVIVETAQPDAMLIRNLFHLYVKRLAAPLGHLLSGNRGAYRYLAESITRFNSAAETAEMLLAAGFKEIHIRPLLFGAVAVHTATKG